MLRKSRRRRDVLLRGGTQSVVSPQPIVLHCFSVIGTIWNQIQNLATENWRDTILDLIDRAEDQAGVDSSETDVADYDDFADDVADDVAGDVLRDLTDSGFDYERSYSQSVGTFVIVQRGTDEEQEAFGVALEKAKEAVFPKIVAKAMEFAAAIAERRAEEAAE